MTIISVENYPCIILSVYKNHNSGGRLFGNVVYEVLYKNEIKYAFYNSVDRSFFFSYPNDQYWLETDRYYWKKIK